MADIVEQRDVVQNGKERSSYPSSGFLICAATAGELTACPLSFAPETQQWVSGVGIPATFGTFWSSRMLEEHSPTLILNIGIAGAYPDTGIAIGDIVLADSDTYGDVGMELPGDGTDNTASFLPLAQTDFGRAFYSTPFPAVLPDFLPRHPLPQDNFSLHIGRGCTVNSCTGSDAVGKRRAIQNGAVFETMEGAAVLQIGQMFGVPVCQIRAISNIAAHRDMRPENIRLALANLRSYLSRIIH